MDAVAALDGASIALAGRRGGCRLRLFHSISMDRLKWVVDKHTEVVTVVVGWVPGIAAAERARANKEAMGI